MKYLFLFLCSLLSFPAWSLTGVVWEKGTKKPLREINVFLLPSKAKAITGDKGQFELPTTDVGNCQVIVNVTGYKKFERAVACDASELPIYLEKIDYNQYETTVTTKAAKRDAQAQGLSQEEFISMPGTFGGDPVRAAQNLPGVGQSGGGAQIIVQGASPDDTGYFINGHRVPLVFHFGGLSSVVIPQAVERVDLLPSGYGPEYSRAIGGVINLQIKKPKSDRHHGFAFVDLLTSGAMFEGPLSEKSSYLVAGRYSYVGHVLKAVATSNEDFELTTAPTYGDAIAIYDRELSDNWNFKTTFIASRDNLELALNRAAQDDPQLRGNFQNTTEFFRLLPQLTGRLDARTTTDHSLAIGRDSILIDVNGRYLKIESDTMTHRSEVVRTWSPQHKSYGGLDNQFDLSKVRVNLPNSYDLGGVQNPFGVGDERKFDTNANEAQLGAYLRHEYRPDENGPWTLLPNMRVDHFSITHETLVQPRFQTRYQVNSALEWHTAVGRYVQPPRPQESSAQYGNSNVRSPQAIHYMAGWSRDYREGATQGLQLTNNYFYKTLDSLVVPSIEDNYDNTGTGTILGGEVQAKYQEGPWNGQVVYTYLNSKRRIPGQGEYPAEFDQTHNLNLILARQHDRWTYSGRFRLVSGAPYTPVNGATFDSDNDVYIPIRGGLYSRRFPTFYQLDLRAEKKTIYDRWILSWYVDVQNITNAANPSAVEYSYDYRKKKATRGLPILPTFGVRGEF
jgi:hypothetical protein